MRKKVRASLLPRGSAAPVHCAAPTPRAYPTLQALFGATPEMRSWIASRLASMARHAALAGVTVTALGCGHGDSAPPRPVATVSPIAAQPLPPAPPSAPAPTPVAAPTPTAPAAGAAAAAVADPPCPDHPGGHVVPAARVAHMTREQRALFHAIGAPGTDTTLADAFAHGGGNLGDLGRYSMGGGCPAFQGNEHLGGTGIGPTQGGGLGDLQDAGTAHRRHRTPHAAGG